jgi:chromosome segregation ATPase
MPIVHRPVEIPATAVTELRATARAQAAKHREEQEAANWLRLRELLTKADASPEEGAELVTVADSLGLDDHKVLEIERALADEARLRPIAAKNIEELHAAVAAVAEVEKAIQKEWQDSDDHFEAKLGDAAQRRQNIQRELSAVGEAGRKIKELQSRWPKLFTSLDESPADPQPVRTVARAPSRPTIVSSASSERVLLSDNREFWGPGRMEAAQRAIDQWTPPEQAESAAAAEVDAAEITS